jgi:hypothetical protein
MNHKIGLTQDKDFLVWLRNRLNNKYNEDQLVLDSLNNIIRYKQIVSSKIDLGVVNKICNKFWPNFDGNNTSDIVGLQEYSEKEKTEIRNMVMNILIEGRKELLND